LLAQEKKNGTIAKTNSNFFIKLMLSNYG
jgi:hypothetical protein